MQTDGQLIGLCLIHVNIYKAPRNATGDRYATAAQRQLKYRTASERDC